MKERFSKDPLAVFSGIFIVLILAVFPLYFKDYYFDILDVKYRFYWISSLVYIVSSLIVIIGALAAGKREKYGIPGRVELWAFLKDWRVSFPLWMLLLFWVNCVISTFQSDYFYESFWGNEGRYTGLFLISIYVWTTVLLGMFARSNRFYVDVAVVVTGIVGALGICDYLEIDVLGFQKASELVPNKNEFMSTIGNVNFYTAFLSLGVTAAATMFVVEKKRWRRILYLFLSVVGYAAMIFGQSDSVYITIGFMFMLLPLFCLREIKSIERILLQMALFVTTLGLIVYLNSNYKKVIETRNIFDVLGEHAVYIHLLIGVLWVLTVLAVLVRKRIEKKPELQPENSMRKCRMIWKIIVLLGIAGILFVILDANFGSNPEKYGDFKFYLVFADKWGSSRGMVWRIGISSWLKQPLMHKLFGYGPETFGILTWEYRTETITASHSIFDSMHNEYLQNLVTMGPIGMLSYMFLLISSVINLARKGKEQRWLCAVAVAIACYGIQAMVNISMPLVAPVLWIYLGIGLSSFRSRLNGKKEGGTEAEY